MSLSLVRSLLICNSRYFTDCIKLISELSINGLGDEDRLKFFGAIYNYIKFVMLYISNKLYIAGVAKLRLFGPLLTAL